MANDKSRVQNENEEQGNDLAAADAKQDHVKMPSKKDDSSTHSSFEKMSTENPKPDGGRRW